MVQDVSPTLRRLLYEPVSCKECNDLKTMRVEDRSASKPEIKPGTRSPRPLIHCFAPSTHGIIISVNQASPVHIVFLMIG